MRRSNRNGRPWITAVAAIVALASCSGGAAGERGAEDASSAPALALPDLSAITVDIAGVAPDAVGPPASTPEAAVAQFVAAEAAGDFAGSFDMLSSVDRAQLPTRQAWTRAHGYLPGLQGFTQDSITSVSDGTATVGGIVSFVPSLDDVRGLVPATGRANWTAIAEDGGWRISYAGSRIDPKYPEPAGADGVVAKWAAAEQRCEAPSADVALGGGLLGATGLIDALCGSEGAVVTGAVGELGDRAEADAVLASYGPAADRWAHVVRLEQPVEMDVVVAPTTSSWLVVGVLASQQ